MGERTIRCVDCGRRNRVPAGALVEAHCRRCESALTYYTWVAAGLRSRGLKRSVQVVGAAALLATVFGGQVMNWWESEPFRLTEAAAEAALPEDSLAGESLAAD